MVNRLSVFLVVTALSAPVFTVAQDKSASSVIQLPGAGGTVTSEEGSFGLNNNTGSAKFVLPIPELPQRGKFGPTIQLGYNQFAGDSGSGLGIGWGFSVPSIMVNDDLGTAIPGLRPDGDFFSHLSFMGSRLIFQGVEAGVKMYRPEYSELFVDVRHHSAPFEVVTLSTPGELTSETIESGFEVRYPDGSRMYFSGNASVAEGNFNAANPYVTKWPIVLHVNSSHDAIRYQYNKHGERSYLTSVEFAGGQSVHEFSLIDTQSSLVSNATGVRQQNAKLYGKMVSKFNDTIYDQWCFGYIGRSEDDNTQFTVRADDDCIDQAQNDLEGIIDTESVNVLDQLRIVYRYGDTGGGDFSTDALSYPEIRFDYSSWTAASLVDRDLVFEAPNLSFAADLPPSSFELADLNMDSLVDVVLTGSDETTVLAGEGSLADSFSESSPLTLQRSNDAGETTEVVPRLSETKFHFADIMGDSYTDIVEIEEGALHIFNGNADGDFEYIGRQINVPIEPKLFIGGNGRFTDINLDGQSDIITTEINANGRTEWRILLNLTRRQSNGRHLVNFGAINKALPFTSQDTKILSRRDTRLTDINGDRLPDLVVIKPANAGFCIYENNGNIFDPDVDALLFGDKALEDSICGHGRFSAIQGMGANDELATMWYVDVNGDGILDFASMGERIDQVRVWLGFGDGSYIASPVDLSLNLRVQVGSDVSSFRSRVTDLDADGQSEILIFQQPSGDDIKAVVVIDFNRTDDIQLTKANLLTTVDFASGRRHDVRYATSTDEMLRDRENDVDTTKLHFPIVVAKQMLTSEGLPGDQREDVRVEEFFYHRPFYDSINGRFIGFSAVDKATYGDEYKPDLEVTQNSTLDLEQYYSFADNAADLHLAGKLKVRKTYEVLEDPIVVASIEDSASFDPAAIALHSLSTSTRNQTLPRTGSLLSCQSSTWQAIEVRENVNYLRKLSDQRTVAAASDHQQDGDDEVCLNPTSTIEFSGFDEFNIHSTEKFQLREINSADGSSMPGRSRVTTNDYAASRSALASLGVLNAVSERRIEADEVLQSQEMFTYLPEHGGRLGSRELKVFSRLVDVPDELENRVLSSRSLKKNMRYDVFGNIIEMLDDLGSLEAVKFEQTGTLPIMHTRFSGQSSAHDQITTMTYNGSREGALSEQITPLGMQISYLYDALGRRIVERAADGAEKRYHYKIGVRGLPSLIMTTKRRFGSEAETPPSESEVIDMLAAYNARGNRMATIENVATGGVRIFDFSEFNRNDLRIFKWTPYSLTEFSGNTNMDVQGVFEIGKIPLPDKTIGNSYRYDAVGRVIRESHPSGKISNTDYHEWGLKLTSLYSDGLSSETGVTEEFRILNEYGMHEHIIGNARGTRHLSSFKRDSLGYLSEIMLAQETEPRRFIYNSVGDMEYQSIPQMGEMYYFYDERGRQTARVKVSGDGTTHLLEYEYDFLNRRVVEKENGVERVKTVYDERQTLEGLTGESNSIEFPLGKITAIDGKDPNGLFDTKQRFGYDQNGRTVHHEFEINGEVYAEKFKHTLDGVTSGISGPGGLSANYAFGPDSNLRSVTIEHPTLQNAEKVISDIAYNPEGRVQRIDYRANAFTELSYNPETLFLSNIQTSAGDGTPLQDLAMTFNQNGSITEIVDSVPASSPEFGHVDRSGQFVYDFKNQLIQYSRYGETVEFEYSEAGSIVRNDEFESGTNLTLPEDASTGLVPRSSESTPYAFDGFGQLMNSPTIQSTEFDGSGRLIKAQTESHRVLFGYDQTGRRVYKQIESISDDSETALYLFPLQSHHVGPKGAESFTVLGSRHIVRMEHENGRWFYYLKDHLESSDYLMTSDSEPVEQMLYRAYGTEHQPERLSVDWESYLTTMADSVPNEKTHHRFTGKYLDDATGLYYYGARYYDPLLGRFISPDPLYINDPERCTSNPISCGLFTYANNNPMAFIDPTGLDLVVAEDHREEISDELQRMDPTARVDDETGDISQSYLHGAWLDVKDFFVPGTGHDAGRELVSRVIESEQTTTIQYSEGDAEINGILGGDAVISYDPAFTPALHEFDPSSGTVSTVPADPAIILGHELVHSTRMMSGDWDYSDTITTGMDGGTYIVPNEEARTVGVGGTSAPNDITENQLREMMGVNPRNHYD